MKVGIYRIKRLDLVNLHGLMAGNTLGSGKMGSKREKENTLMNLDKLRKGLGRMANF